MPATIDRADTVPSPAMVRHTMNSRDAVANHSCIEIVCKVAMNSTSIPTHHDQWLVLCSQQSITHWHDPSLPSCTVPSEFHGCSSFISITSAHNTCRQPMHQVLASCPTFHISVDCCPLPMLTVAVQVLPLPLPTMAVQVLPLLLPTMAVQVHAGRC